MGQEPDNEFHRDGFDPQLLWYLIEQALLTAASIPPILGV
jgi:hypothetical protein